MLNKQELQKISGQKTHRNTNVTKIGILLLSTIYMILTSILVNATERHYAISLSSMNGTISFNSVDVVGGDVLTSDAGDYTAKTISTAGEILSTSKLDIEKDNTDRIRNFILMLPYYPNAKSVWIYDSGGNMMLQIDVTAYGKSCGNKICEPQESYENCQADCPSGGRDDYCDGISDGKCDADCEPNEDSDCVPAKRTPVQSVKTPAIETKPAEITKEISAKTVMNTDSQDKKQGPINTLLIYVIIIMIGAVIVGFIMVRGHQQKTAYRSQIREYIIQTTSKGYPINSVRQALIDQKYNPNEIDRVIEDILKNK